jgi:hypothetical protein
MGTRVSGTAGRVVAVVAVSLLLSVSACGSSPKPGVIEGRATPCVAPGLVQRVWTIVVKDRAGKEVAQQSVAWGRTFRVTVKRGDYVVSLRSLPDFKIPVHVVAGHTAHVPLGPRPGVCK